MFIFKIPKAKQSVKVLDLLDPSCLNISIPAGNYREMKNREGRKRKEASRAHIAPEVGRYAALHSITNQRGNNQFLLVVKNGRSLDQKATVYIL